jgi:hypothetical protein
MAPSSLGTRSLSSPPTCPAMKSRSRPGLRLSASLAVMTELSAGSPPQPAASDSARQQMVMFVDLE